MTYNPQRLLKLLYDRIVKPDANNALYQLEKIDETILREYDIQLRSFDCEDIPPPDSSAPFRPLSQAWIDRHPIDPAQYPGVNSYRFTEYPPATEELRRKGFWKPEDCADRVNDHLERWLRGFPRSGFTGAPPPGSLGIRNLLSESGWWRMRIPNPMLLNCTFRHSSLKEKDFWHAGQLYESATGVNNLPITPHVSFMCTHNAVGVDGAILYTELAAIITVMNQRARQPFLSTDEDEEERFFDEIEDCNRKQSDFPLAFSEEKRFPALMASLFGPQHGRLVYAMIEDGQLAIHMTRIYSFEKEATAPWDLFTRWLLSSPV